MLKPSPQESASTQKSLSDANLEAYEVIEIHRSELKGAPYNPRQLNDKQKRKLKAGLKRHGLVSPPTWNKRSGFIVGGHQRIAIMDDLMGTHDYKMRVAAIDVDSGREKELNLLLNNSMAQGQWDVAMLDEILKDSEIDISGTGFEVSDVYQLLGTAPFETRSEDAKAMSEKLEAITALYDSIKNRNAAKEGSEFYLVFVFKTEDHAVRFIEQGKGRWDSSRYQNGEALADALGYKLNADMGPPGVGSVPG